MPTSDSEGFESADEGHDSVEKKDRKKRNSSSNYSDIAIETSEAPKISSPGVITKQQVDEKQKEGWDDFDIEDSEPVIQQVLQSTKPDEPKNKSSSKPDSKVAVSDNTVDNTQDTGWDDFRDWGDENTTVYREQPRSKPHDHDKDLKQMTDKLAAMNSAPASSSWGWGWGVDSILSTASAGLSTLTNQVSQGFTTVLETGIGAPDPEELARKNAESTAEQSGDLAKGTPAGNTEDKPSEPSGDGAFTPFGSILKFVGDTGSKVITGGLDTLEIIGRKTIEVLQDGDPHLAKKRALLGLEPGVPVLSQVLREAKAKAEEEDKIREERREAKEIHYERLFDDFEGLVHLEALEMLAKQVNMKIEERIQSATGNKKTEIKETLQQVSELCELAEDEDDVPEPKSSDLPKDEEFHENLQEATKDLGVKLQFQPLVKHYKDTLAWIENPESDFSIKSINRRAITSLAQATALSVEIYHKAAEMLLVKPRRMTADEADGMTQMTMLLIKHIDELAQLFTSKMREVSSAGDCDDPSDYITKIFLEADNSSTYIRDAFILSHPMIQIGAI